MDINIVSDTPKHLSAAKLYLLCAFLTVIAIIWGTVKYNIVNADEGKLDEPMQYRSSSNMPEELMLGLDDFCTFLHAEDKDRTQFVKQLGYKEVLLDNDDASKYTAYEIGKNEIVYGRLYFRKESRNMVFILNSINDYNFYIKELSKFLIQDGTNSKYKIADGCFLIDVTKEGYKFILKTQLN